MSEGAGPEVSSDFIFPIVYVTGLRFSNLVMTEDGLVDFGCVKVHVDDLELWTDDMVRDQGGQNALDWWLRWKPVLIPFFKLALEEIESYWDDPDNTDIPRDLAMNTARPEFSYVLPTWPQTPTMLNEKRREGVKVRQQPVRPVRRTRARTRPR